MNRFNPFKILKVQDQEIRHSNMLAWIFNPAENHNFDDRILKRFLLKVLLKPVNEDTLDNMNIIYRLQQASLLDIKVYRELEHIDLVLISEQQHLIIFIENKIYSGEHSNQLQRYYDFIKQTYADYMLLPIYLTIEGTEATQTDYFLAGYEDILDTIEFILANYFERTSTEVVAFLKYYLTIIKEKYVMEPELKRLCKEIYQQNKDIIDMIHSVGNEIDIEPAVHIFKQKYPHIIPVSIKSKTFWFGIDSFIKGKSDEIDNWGGGFPVCFWFTEYFGKLKLTLEVGPFIDASRRINFLNKLESLDIKISEKAKEPGRKYTRIHNGTYAIKDWSDNDELAEAMEKLYEKDDIRILRDKVAKAINEFDWQA